MLEFKEQYGGFAYDVMRHGKELENIKIHCRVKDGRFFVEEIEFYDYENYHLFSLWEDDIKDLINFLLKLQNGIKDENDSTK